MHHRRVRVTIAFVFALAGCGGQTRSESIPLDGGRTSPGDDGTTREHACADWADAWCSKYETCWPLFIRANFGDATQCTAEIAAGCAELWYQRTPVSPASLAACAASFRTTETCDALLSRQNGTPECDGLRGAVPLGEPCASSWECGEGCCAASGTGECPVCTAKVAVGGTCTTPFDCDSGLLCSDDGHCVKPGVLGDACGLDAPCLRQLGCRAGTCVAPGEVGDDCTPQADHCDALKGLYCNTKTSRCEPVLFAHTGESCGFLDGYPGAYTLCVAGAGCEPADEMTGTCVGPLALGEPCDPLRFPACASPAACIAGVCRDTSACR